MSSQYFNTDMLKTIMKYYPKHQLLFGIGVLTLITACGGDDNHVDSNKITSSKPPLTTDITTNPNINHSQSLSPQSHLDINATGVNLCADETSNHKDCTKLSNDWQNLKQDAQIKAGKPLSYQHIKITNSHDECIQDVNTKQYWEKKTTTNKDKRYTFSEAENYVKALNAQRYCGQDNWRLPQIYELYALVDFGKNPKTQEPIDDFFTNDLPVSDADEVRYWSATISADDYTHEHTAWLKTLQLRPYLSQGEHGRNTQHAVRAVTD